MDNSPFRFDLFDVVRIFFKWKKYILGLAIIASVVMAIFMLTQKNYYKGYGSFYPASSVISGRINLFRVAQQDWIDYFGEENEVDRAFVIGSSAPVISHLIDSFKMAEHYKIDSKNDPQGKQKVYKRFMKNYKISRTGYNHLEITFSDNNSELASAIVNEAMYAVENSLREIFVNINRQLAISIDIRKDSIDQELKMYTDSLVSLRKQYGIYDIVAPSRQVTNGYGKGSGPGYADGLELIQNVEEFKDKLAIDRAKYHSISNEFKTSMFKGFPMIHVVQWATPYGPKAGPYRIIAVLSTFLIAFLFALLVACVIDIFHHNKSRYA